MGFLAWLVEFRIETSQSITIVRSTISPNGKDFIITNIDADVPSDFNLSFRMDKKQ